MATKSESTFKRSPRRLSQQIKDAETTQNLKARRTAEQLLVARPNFTIAAWLETQFSRRDIAQVEADTLALRAAELPPV